EDQVQDTEHRLDAFGQLLARRHLVRNARLANLPLRAYQALRGGGFRLDEPARDLTRRQAAQRAERQRGARVRRDGRMAAREEEPEPVVLDRRRVFELGRRHFDCRLQTAMAIAADATS